MERKKCSIHYCFDMSEGRGFCEYHYKRWRATGQPLRAGDSLLQADTRSKSQRDKDFADWQRMKAAAAKRKLLR